MPRVVDATVERLLTIFGAIEITGTMWSGKTWTAEHHGKSEIKLFNEQIQQLVRADATIALAGETPRVIDEWQEVLELWDSVRYEVDRRGQRGLYLLTGSSRPSLSKVHHSGAGRIARLRMWPMSLFEQGISDGSVSLAALFEGAFEPAPVECGLKELAQAVCRGGWPAINGLSLPHAALVISSYSDLLCESWQKDSAELPAQARAFLRALARDAGGTATLETLAKDAFPRLNASKRSLQELARRWLRAFVRRFVIDEVRGWDAPILSPQRLRVRPKRYFCDPSLAASFLGLSPERLLTQNQVFGRLFETLCMRDLHVYLQAMEGAHEGSLCYYRDTNGLEVDTILELRDGRWGAFEIKLGWNAVENAEKNLLRLARKIANNPAAEHPKPSFLAVLVGATPLRYRTQSSVLVIPITHLGP